ncbi:hypothetical protein [Candidatus Foliamicus sp.]
MSKVQALEAKRRVEQALEALRVGLGGYVRKHMRDRHGKDWRRYASWRMQRGQSTSENHQGALRPAGRSEWLGAPVQSEMSNRGEPSAANRLRP